MNKLRAIAGAGILLALAGGCGSREPTAEERAAAQRRIEAGQRQKLEDDVAAFPTIARQMITSLEAIGPRDVADIQAAIATVRLFDQAARNVRIVEDAALEGAITISSDASKAKDDLKQVLIRKQRELFPQMRRTYAAHLSGAVAGLQANFRAVGADGKTLRAASPSFTSREVVMEAHYTLASQANRFRFSRAEYIYSLTGASDVIEMRGREDGEVF